MDKYLHIVAHDVPWPADFGGVVDLYYKLVWLQKAGIKIHLHCFVHKRPEARELESLCASVTYYQRKTGIKGIRAGLPYIVSSRINEELVNNLNADEHPVLLEGIHCSYPLFKGLLNKKKVLVRLPNIEFRYYQELGRNENNLFRKSYFLLESKLLYNYEKKLARKAKFLALSSDDANDYRELFVADASFLPVFLPWKTVESKPGRGSYCLYHGNLEISENQRAVEWLLQHIFSELQIPLVIAGKNPPASLVSLTRKNQHACMIESPSHTDLQDMIAKAHINILPSFNSTGVKLKLLNAVYNGRFCIVNQAGVTGSGLDELCLTAETDQEFISLISKTYQAEFTDADIRKRESVATGLYNNELNAEKLIALIY